MTRRPRVLYLAFYFPPSRASGVFRAVATANAMVRGGFDVTVATAPREFFTDYIHAIDPTVESTVDPRVRVVRPSMRYSHWEQDIRRFGRVRATVPSLWSAARGAVRERSFPEPYASWLPRVVARAVRDHARRPYDLVVATGNPFTSFAAAWWLHRLLRVPYVLDYRDAWTFNQFTEQLSFPPQHRAWSWQQRVIERAAEVAFVNEGMRQWHAGRYPQAADRMTVVPNGWEPQDLGPLGAPTPPDRPLRFGYLGTVTETMPVDELGAGWRRAREDPSLEGAELRLYGHLGFFPRQTEALRARLPLDDPSVRYLGPVARADVARTYDQLDVLLLWLPGARYVTSGKVFEYMGTGRPVVSVHDPGIAATEVLEQYPAWVRTPELTADAVGASLLAGARLARSATPASMAAARSSAMRWTREAVLDPFVHRLGAVARG